METHSTQHGPDSSALPATAAADVQVGFYWRERQAVDRVARRLCGRALLPAEYAGLAGAPPHSAIEVGIYRRGLVLELRDPRARDFFASWLLTRGGGLLSLVNDGYYFGRCRWPNSRWLARLVHQQALAAGAVGAGRIVVTAGRGPSDRGCWFWPRCGFDGPLPRPLAQRLPADLHDAHSVLDLMSSEPGRAWWRRHGLRLKLVFDLTPASRSWQMLHGESRRQKAESGEREAEGEKLKGLSENLDSGSPSPSGRGSG